MKKTKRFLILSDGKLGHQNQSVKLVENLGCKDYDILILRRRSFGKLLSYLSPSFITTDMKSLKRVLLGGKYDVVVGAGTVPRTVMLWIKNNYFNIKTICLMDPKSNYDKYDIIAAPTHDKIKYKGKNLVRFVGSLSSLSKKDLQEAKKMFKEEFSKFNKPLIGVLVGGNSKGYVFNKNKAIKLSKKIKELASSSKGSVYATTSRRTGEEQTKIIKDELKGKNFKVYSGEGENPYKGILSYSDIIIVTPETVSMLTEACSTGAKVFVFDKNSVTSKRVKRFVEELIDKELVFELESFKDVESLKKSKNKSQSFIEEQMQKVIKFIKEKI